MIAVISFGFAALAVIAPPFVEIPPLIVSNRPELSGVNTLNLTKPPLVVIVPVVIDPVLVREHINAAATGFDSTPVTFQQISRIHKSNIAH